MSTTEIHQLMGKTIIEINVMGYGKRDLDEIEFTLDTGVIIAMLHHNDCCEQGAREEGEGDFRDLLNSPIVVAEETTNSNGEWDDNAYSKELQLGHLLKGTIESISDADLEVDESTTWTFYKLDTVKGGVTLRWFGTSNGYYSESISVEEVNRNSNKHVVANYK